MKLKNLLANIVLAGALALGNGCKKEVSLNPSSSVSLDDRVSNEAILNYIADPKFTGKDFSQQVTGTKARLETYNLDQNKVYFSINTNDFRDDTTKTLSSNPENVQFGKTDSGDFTGGKIRLGKYVLNDPSSYFFSLPAQDFRVDPKRIVNVNLGNLIYNQSVRELADFILNESVHGGNLKILIGNKSGADIIQINHGAFVAKKGETSLTRLVNSLVKPNDGQEVVAQKLLDFVTDKMKYDYGDIAHNIETMRRPNEVVMNKGSDCSGLTILYSSLLEQRGIPHQLVYYPNHINVAVTGNFPNENGYAYQIATNKYSIAEPTTKGFQIGRTRLSGFDINNMERIQSPGKNALVFDAKTGKALSFR